MYKISKTKIDTNIDGVKDEIFDEKIDVLAVRETWMNESCVFETEEVRPHGLFSRRSEKWSTSHGEVGLTIDRSTNLDPFKNFTTIKHCLVELLFDSKWIRIIVQYRPPSFSASSFFDAFTSDL